MRVNGASDWMRAHRSLLLWSQSQQLAQEPSPWYLRGRIGWCWIVVLFVVDDHQRFGRYGCQCGGPRVLVTVRRRGVEVSEEVGFRVFRLSVNLDDGSIGGRDARQRARGCN